MELELGWERGSANVEEGVKADFERIEDLDKVAVGAERDGACARAARTFSASFGEQKEDEELTGQLPRKILA